MLEKTGLEKLEAQKTLLFFSQFCTVNGVQGLIEEATAFRELGRVVRTIFLLNYINDIELRRMIHAATCKSEEFNNFIDWVAFGRDGTIANNLQGIQKKIINFGRLAANAVILHVVANMTNVINEMKAEGYDISPEMLNALSPYHTSHLNRFGLFSLTGNRDKLKVEFKLN